MSKSDDAASKVVDLESLFETQGRELAKARQERR